MFQEQTLEVTTTCWWWPSTFVWKESASQNTQESSLTSKRWKDPNVLETLEAMIGRKFTRLTIMNNEDTNMDSMITTFKTAVTETAGELLAKLRQKKKKNPESLQTFLTCATKGENWERKDFNLKDRRNIRKWTTTSIGSWKRRKKKKKKTP